MGRWTAQMDMMKTDVLLVRIMNGCVKTKNSVSRVKQFVTNWIQVVELGNALTIPMGKIVSVGTVQLPITNVQPMESVSLYPCAL